MYGYSIPNNISGKGRRGRLCSYCVLMSNSREKDVRADWRELESDPGLFSLLVKDLGVRGVKVEEIYDVFSRIEGRVYGFVYLFRFGGRSGSRTTRTSKSISSEGESFVLEPDIVNGMFFAEQIANNSCATHALLGVLLNCKDVELGETLTSLKSFSSGLSPENKGYKIANMPYLARAHNKYARPDVSVQFTEKKGSSLSTSRSSAHQPDTYHFVSFVPINGRVFELDGLKKYPIDHGPWGEHEDWTDLFRRTIAGRFAQSEDFHANLMIVIPDPVPLQSDILKFLYTNQHKPLEVVDSCANFSVQSNETNEEHISRSSYLEIDDNVKKAKILQMEEVSRSLPSDVEELRLLSMDSPSDSAYGDLRISASKVLVDEIQIDKSKRKLEEHNCIMLSYQLDHLRRVHEYDHFVTEFTIALAEENRFPQHIMMATEVKSQRCHVGSRRKKVLKRLKKCKVPSSVNGS